MKDPPAHTPQSAPSVWLHRQLVALKAEYSAWQKRQSSRSLYTSAHAITEESAATLAHGNALHCPFSATIAASHDPGRWSAAAAALLQTIEEEQLDEATAIESLLLATEARHNAGHVYPQAITAGGMLDLSKQALAHTAALTPPDASDLIAAKDNAGKTGNRDKARESIGRLTDRPAWATATYFKKLLEKKVKNTNYLSVIRLVAFARLEILTQPILYKTHTLAFQYLVAPGFFDGT